MKRIIQLFAVSLIALGLNAAVDSPAPTAPDQPTTEQKWTMWDKIKEWKATKFKEAMSKAGVDDATATKVMENLKALKDEKKAEYKKLKESYKDKMTKTLTDSGLTPEKAEEVIKNYKDEVMSMKDKVKTAIHEYMEKMKGSHTPETPKAQ